MNLSILLIIPLITASGVLLCRNAAQVRMTALLGSLVQLGYSSAVMYGYMAERGAGNKTQMLFQPNLVNQMVTFSPLAHSPVSLISYSMIV